MTLPWEPWWLIPVAMALLCGLVCPLLGTLLVVQQRVVTTNLMAYAVLPGMVISQSVGGSARLGGLISTLATVAIVEPWLSTHAAAGRDNDAVRNSVLAGCLGLGVLLVQLLQTHLELEALLFGDLLTSDSHDLLWLAAAGSLLLLLLATRFNQLQWLALDPDAAAAFELPIRQLHLAMAALSGLVVVAAASAVGLALVMALMYGPALLGLHRAKTLRQALVRASMAGLAISAVSCVLALLLDQPPGPLLAVVTCGALPLLALQKA